MSTLPDTMQHPEERRFELPVLCQALRAGKREKEKGKRVAHTSMQGREKMTQEILLGANYLSFLDFNQFRGLRLGCGSSSSPFPSETGFRHIPPCKPLIATAFLRG